MPEADAKPFAAADIPSDDDGDEYHESEDEDFDVSKAAAEAGDESTSDDDDGGTYASDNEDNENIKLSTSSKRKRRADGDDDEEEEDKPGIKILTRSQRAAEDTAKTSTRDKSKSTIDTDALWASMRGTSDTPASTTSPAANRALTTSPRASVLEDAILITETYEFAKEIVTREVRVPRDSPKAIAFLERQQQDRERQNSATPDASTSTPSTASSTPKPRGNPLSRRRKGTSLEQLVGKGKPAKINTLEKSKLDWQGFVSQEGIEGDLKRHNQGGYLHKQDFLARVDSKRYTDLKEGQKALKKS
ncbi:bucentaur or craniofacial development-domain-containing protein [Limtongia smithiae]|uniref:bucentaur or craniofacial development-domain-containing protein n=1 Tax=Limtongia smithiae TaxID=1125753 RepID=UPI0034CFF424